MDRKHSFAGQKNLDWFFANRKWVRTARLQIVECAWAVRPLPAEESSIRFLVMAPKRSYKRAHDRNKVKRWLRAAVNATAAFELLEARLGLESKQLLVMVRISRPLDLVNWPDILGDTQRIADHLTKRTEAGA